MAKMVMTSPPYAAMPLFLAAFYAGRCSHCHARACPGVMPAWPGLCQSRSFWGVAQRRTRNPERTAVLASGFRGRRFAPSRNDLGTPDDDQPGVDNSKAL